MDDELICRASLWEELGRRGVPAGPERQRLRTRLVKELESQGLIRRPHPRSRYLLILKPPPDLRRRLHAGFDARKLITTGFDADAERSADRRRQLNSYFRDNVLDGNDFVCASWGPCANSIAPGCTFTEGQLSHIGRHYDLSKDGQELRVVVVGQEVGGRGNARISMQERSKVVHEGSGLTRRFESEPGRQRRNPHMRGTTLALRELFGLPPTGEHHDEFIAANGKRVHMFDCFALINRLLCAAHLLNAKTGARTSTGKPTRTMLRNCDRHFRATLEILEPTVVVVQGVKVWRWSQDVLVPIKSRGKGLWECELSGRRVVVAPFTHPSSWGTDRWDSPTSPYFVDVVRPALRRARAIV